MPAHKNSFIRQIRWALFCNRCFGYSWPAAPAVTKSIAKQYLTANRIRWNVISVNADVLWRSYAFLATLPSNIQCGHTPCSKKGWPDRCARSAVSCSAFEWCGKWLCLTTHVCWRLRLKLGAQYVRPFIRVQHSSSIYTEPIMKICSRMQPGAKLCRSTNSWSCNKHRNVAPHVDANARIRAKMRGSVFRHWFHCYTCWELADKVSAISSPPRGEMVWATYD